MTIRIRAQDIVLAEIASLGSFAETAAAKSAWWDSLSKKEKREYILKHPKSKYAQSTTGQTSMKRHGARTSRKIQRTSKMIERRSARIGRLQERHAALSAKAKELGRGHPRAAKIKERLARIKEKIGQHSSVLKKHQSALKEHQKTFKGIVGGLGKDGEALQKHHDSGKRVAYKSGKIGVADSLTKALGPAKKTTAPASKSAPKPAAKPALKKTAAPAKPAAEKFPGKKGSLHEHLKVPKGEKLPTDKLTKLAESDHPLADRAKMALRFRGVKGDIGKKPEAAPAKAPAKSAPKKPVAKPAPKKPVAKPAPKKVAKPSVEDALKAQRPEAEEAPASKAPAAKTKRKTVEW